MILDPEFHQSIWKPWQSPVADAAATAEPAMPPRPRRALVRALVVVAAIGVTMALVLAAVIPRLLDSRGWQEESYVKHMPTQPQIAWTSEGAQPCGETQNGDHAILKDARRVWSLDLNNGHTRWSVDISGPGRLTCLPAADLVAVTILSTEDRQVLHTTLLRASSGEEVADLPGDSTTQVIPMGADIGLVDSNNQLRMVHPEDLDAPLWTRQLLGPPGQLEPIIVEQVDDDVLQLVYWAQTDTSEHVTLLTLNDGEPPAWASAPPNQVVYHRRSADVITRTDYSTGGPTGPDVSILDLQGQQMWNLGEDKLTIAGSRFFRSSRVTSGPDSGWSYSHLREVDRRTGSPINDDTYEGQFDYVHSTNPDRLQVMLAETLRILDEHLQEVSTLSVENVRLVHDGRKFLYVESTEYEYGEDQKVRLSALDPDRGRVVWTFDLEAGASLGQLGQHLVIVDADGSFHGLKSR
ncbi:MAG: hypothetical protein Q4P15_11065 [Propionibacteriaceae bacterium]|nr:hypothetical protein [Propionibacteriaceae bacterium]